MNVALAGGLLGLGYCLTPEGGNDRQIKTERNGIKKTNRGGDSRNVANVSNVYDQSISRYANEYEKRIVSSDFEKMHDPIVTNVVPPFFNRNIYNPVENNLPVQKQSKKNAFSVNSLSGEKIPVEKFTHSNMVPFFGSHIRQNVDGRAHSNLLETFSGSEPVNYIQKNEQPPLFKPQSNQTFVHGMPSKIPQTVDRFIPSSFRQGEFPFQPLHVGPGLGLDYDAPPTGGFQQDTRDYERPKTIDELRQGSNVKQTYEGRLNPSKSRVTNRGLESEVVKRSPDKYYENSKDRYMTTVSTEKEPMYRSKVVDAYTHRSDTCNFEYKGNAGPVQQVKSDLRIQKYQSPTKTSYENKESNFRNTAMTSQKTNDFGKSSFQVQETKRNSIEAKTYLSNVVSLFYAAMAPLQDVLRPTRNQELIEKDRATSGNLQKLVKKGVVHDPTDIARPTIKQDTGDNEHIGFMGADKRATIVYDHANDIARVTIRETTSENDRNGNVGGKTAPKGVVYDPESVARTTVKETTLNADRAGNIGSTSRRGVAYDPDDIAKTTIKETTLSADRAGNMGSAITSQRGKAYDPNDFARTTINETLLDGARIGNVEVAKTRGEVVPSEDILRSTVKETTLEDPNIATRNMGNLVSTVPLYEQESFRPKTTVKEMDVEKTTLTSTFQKRDGAYNVTAAYVNDTTRQMTGSTNYSGSMESQSGKVGGYNVSNFVADPTQRESMSSMTYKAAALSVTGEKPVSYDAYYNAEINANHEMLEEGRAPTDTGAKTYVGKDEVDGTVQIVSTEVANERGNSTTRTSTIYLPLDPGSITKDKNFVEHDDASRTDPALLDAFRKNPYTQSLSSTN